MALDRSLEVEETWVRDVIDSRLFACRPPVRHVPTNVPLKSGQWSNESVSGRANPGRLAPF